uniref:Uncharacterized protein n=1 Tax=Rhizophora mucronata TaxID=61149 RepID=A0A2P2PL89_RHIMU
MQIYVTFGFRAMETTKVMMQTPTQQHIAHTLVITRTPHGIPKQFNNQNTTRPGLTMMCSCRHVETKESGEICRKLGLLAFGARMILKRHKNSTNLL